MRLVLFLSALGTTCAISLCSSSSNYKVALNDTCASVSGGALVDVAAARGETEAGVVLIDNGHGLATSVTGVIVSWDGGVAPSGVSSTVRLLTYVHTEASPRYAGSTSGWFADALLPWPVAALHLPASSQLTAWVSFHISSTTPPGVFKGTIAVGTAGASPMSIPLSLTVWPLTIPPLTVSPFSTVYAFDESALPRMYKSSPMYDENATLAAFWDTLSELRFPATNIYASAPLPVWQYEALAARGAQVLILADISSLSNPNGNHASKGMRAVLSGATSQLRNSGSGKRARAHDACPTFDSKYITAMVALLQPTWDALGRVGLQHLAAVYGFDEIDVSCEPAVRLLFAAAKSAFPGVRTISAIDWATVPLDLPLDVWVLQYQLVVSGTASAWVAAGHELFVYHCIEPSGKGFMNTFNERDLIEGRLLFWYDHVLGVTGHLYYEVALWLDWTALPPFWREYTTSSGVVYSTTHSPIEVAEEDARLTNWDPANWIWAPRSDIWANGDGVFVYPGPLDAGGVGTPISTVRFETQRDGVEDWHILQAAARVNATAARALVAGVVSAPTVFTRNVSVFEAARRSLAVLAAGG